MSVALPIEAEYLFPYALDRGVVAVHQHGFAHCCARCSCGWTGRRRHLRAAARLDAWQHSIEQNCDVSVPLTVPAIA